MIIKFIVRVLFSLSSLVSVENPRNFQPLLLKQLLDMCSEDEEATLQWMRATEETKEQAYKKVITIRKGHNSILKEIVKSNGWPGIEIIGGEGQEALWLLIQHQDGDLSLQKQCLNLLKEAVDKERANFKHHAYLFDRVRSNEGFSQLYGTQWIVEKGSLSLYPVEPPFLLELLEQPSY